MPSLVLALVLLGRGIASADERPPEPVAPPPPAASPSSVGPAAAPEPPQPAIEEPPAPPSASVIGKVLPGATYKSFYGIPFFGGELGLGLGGQGPTFAVHAQLDLFLGTADFGLLTFHARAGPVGEVRLGRVRLGGSVGGCLMVVHFPNASPVSYEFDLGFAAHLQGSLDLVQWGEGRRGAALS